MTWRSSPLYYNVINDENATKKRNFIFKLKFIKKNLTLQCTHLITNSFLAFINQCSLYFNSTLVQIMHVIYVRDAQNYFLRPVYAK